MKKNKTVLALLLILAVAMASVSASSFATANIDWAFYGGLTLHQYSLKDFKNVRLSDYETHPYNEGSLMLPLADQNGSGMGFGLTVGARGNLSDSFDMIGEVTASMAGKSGVFGNVAVGAIYNFTNAKYRIGAGGKVGYFMYSKSLGHAQILPGTTPPVMLNEGTIRNGDALSYTVSGLSLTPVLDCSFRISRNIAVGIQAGYQFCIPLSSSLHAKGTNDVNIDPQKHKSAYYEPDSEKLVNTSFNPKASVNGFTGTVYCSYVF